ncbi:hypothetical protein [Kitasatospora kifunensis]|uniref:hypothetical protein n=1 Tax=Kitasatospora kifunensis TaxID=58351 RepID=UPI001619CAAA|nr:hypothetical protein [Kitasatospora kifunensis]
MLEEVFEQGVQGCRGGDVVHVDTAAPGADLPVQHVVALGAEVLELLEVVLSVLVDPVTLSATWANPATPKAGGTWSMMERSSAWQENGCCCGRRCTAAGTTRS